MTKTFTYFQHSGTVLDDTGEQIAIGWVGNHEGKNNPDMQQVRCVGPLRMGLDLWTNRGRTNLRFFFKPGQYKQIRSNSDRF